MRCFINLISYLFLNSNFRLGRYTNTDCNSYWETPLGVANRGRGKFIPVCELLGGGL